MDDDPGTDERAQLFGDGARGHVCAFGQLREHEGAAVGKLAEDGPARGAADGGLDGCKGQSRGFGMREGRSENAWYGERAAMNKDFVPLDSSGRTLAESFWLLPAIYLPEVEAIKTMTASFCRQVDNPVQKRTRYVRRRHVGVR